MKIKNIIYSISFICVSFLISINTSHATDRFLNDSVIENSLSGIHIYTSKADKSFYLEFKEILKEDARLTLIAQNEQIRYSQELKAGKNYTGKPFKVGDLKSGIYTIQVTAANKTYWKKVKISR